MIQNRCVRWPLLAAVVCLGVGCAREGSRGIGEMPPWNGPDLLALGQDATDLEDLASQAELSEDDLTPVADAVADQAEEDASAPLTGPCEGPVNVVEEGFSADLKVDLANYVKGNYAIDEHVRLTPTQAGASVSLFGVGFMVGSVSVPYRYEDNVLTVCPGSFHAGETVEFDIRFLVKKNSQFLGVFGLLKWVEDASGLFMVGPSNEPHHAARWWFVPEATFEVDPAHDDSRFVTGLTLEVTAPDPTWTVTGPGGLGTQSGSTWRFTLPQTVPLYAVAFAASPDYELFHVGNSGSGVDIWGTSFPEDREFVEEAYLTAVDTVEFMEAEFGPYIFTGEQGRSLTLVEVPKYGGAMENVGCIWMGTDAMDPLIVAHETVHHWIGNALRFADWPDFWLAEGFTEFITMYHFAAQYLPASDIDWIKNQYRDSGADIGFAFPGALSFEPSENMDKHFISNMSYYYVYGATILEMIDRRLLRAGVGGFWPLLTQKWYCDGCSEVTTADFLGFLQEEAGELGIDWEQFFDDWVYTYQPPPRLTLTDYSFVPDQDAYYLTFNVERTDGNPVALKELQILLVTAEGEATYAVDLAYEQESAMFAALVISEPTLIVVDPDIMYPVHVEAAPNWAGPKVSTSRYGYQY